ncbi:DUF2169 family type VI secretion system accessory protein [Litorisediminicola beolgyonensis]|uniref:DUF2169 domain-containing protein n=1 Tax=Litorisediminicola beolgyonensis TaxID=1173614 RepID=A0ABW3ZKY5_9RHOB
MDVICRIPGAHQMAGAMDVRGREYMVLVVRSTLAFPDVPGGVARAAAEQTPLVYADTFTGAPGFSATLWETDFAFRKARCDVVVQGAAYAPGGRAAERVPVGLRVGGWSKGLNVVGYREWRVFGPSVAATRPHPFTRAQFSYDTAFGGVDRLDPDDKTPPAYLPNPHGRGFASFRNQALLNGAPLPNTEELGREVTSPYEEYRPMALGPVSRAAPQRLRFAGTYDENWEKNIFPFLPPDFDERYLQQVGEDQQIDPPAPGTEVVLRNLTPAGNEAFRLPNLDLPVVIFDARGDTVLDRVMRPDTLLFDTETRRVSAVWRASAPVRRHLSEFRLAWVGHPSRAMTRAMASGRRYVPMRQLERLDS